MPTGYTSDLYEGKETSFEEFALNCSRAFGAMAHLRDDPRAAIPEELKVDDYYYTRVQRDKEEIQYWKDISDEDLEAILVKEKKETLESNYKSCVDRQELKTRYDLMLAEVIAWNPPSDDHLNFKKFMIEQLESSIKADCYAYHDLEDIKYQLANPIVITNVDQHRNEKLENAESSLAYSLKFLEEEERKIAGKNKWINDLRNSLA